MGRLGIRTALERTKVKELERRTTQTVSARVGGGFLYHAQQVRGPRVAQKCLNLGEISQLVIQNVTGKMKINHETRDKKRD